MQKTDVKFILGSVLILFIALSWQINIIQSSLKSVVNKYVNDCKFYRNYYWRYNLTNIIKDTLFYYESQIIQKENVIDFLKQLGDIFEEDITDEELADAEAMIDAITFEGTLYIGVDDNYLYKFDGTVGIEITEDMKDMGGENVSMSANIVISMSDFDKEKDVDVPENSEDLMELIGTMMGGMYGGGTYDDTDYEAYDDIDWSEYDDSEWENWEDEDWGDLETDLDVTEDTTEVTTE